MRIAFDGTTLRPRRTGVGYYTEHLLHHLADGAGDDEITVISNQPVETDLPLPAHVRVAASRRRVPRLAWIQMRAPGMLDAIGADVAHFTNGMVPFISPTPSVVTIHDGSLRMYPRFHPPRRVLLNGPLVSLAARRADAVITVSESARDDIVRAYRVDPARVRVVYEAAGPSFRPVRDRAALDAVRRRYGLAERVILYVGTIEPRKNLPKLIDAFARAHGTGKVPHQLVCVGPYGWMSHGLGERVSSTAEAGSIVFTGYVPSDDLPALYSLAEMFVYPSMYEGFGLPVVEAMACGVPVITGRTAALAEVGAGAALQVERLEADALGDALVELANDPARRARMAAAGLARAAEFSWDRAAGDTMAIYREVAAARRVRVKAVSAGRAPNAGLKPCATADAPPNAGLNTCATVDARPNAGLKPCATVDAPRAAQGFSPVESLAHDFSPAESVAHNFSRAKSVAHDFSPPMSVAQDFSPATGVDVLFGQAYFLRFDSKLWEAQQPYAPLGTLYAAACVRERGYQVALFDAMLAGSVDEWSAALERHRPRFAVIYEDNFNYLSKMCLLRMRDAALQMIDAARACGIPAIVAGADATDHPETYLDRGADVVIAGEGEMTLVDVLDTLSASGAHDLARIDGVCVRNGRGIIRTAPRDVIRDLDALPMPAWDLVDVARYQHAWRSRHGYFSMNIATTRGCPYHCNWCAKPIYGQRYTARLPEHVVEEMVWLKRTYRPDHLWIADDIFGLKPGWIARFADLVRARDATIPFKCLLRADQVTASAAASLRAAGCRTVWMGAESGSQRILDAMEKGTRVDQIVTATSLLRDAGIDVGFFLQFGYPGETREDIDRTLAMVRQCRPDDIGVSVSYPLPGTPFYERVRSQLGEKQNWVDSDDLAMMYRATYAPRFYRTLYSLVHAEFRVRKAAHAIARAVARPWTLRRRHARDLAGLAWHASRLPALHWQLARASARTSAPTLPLLIPLATRQAGVPTDQSTLE